MKFHAPALVVLMLGLFIPTISLANNITIFDGEEGTELYKGLPWYKGVDRVGDVNNAREDQEVEKGMVGEQKWDLEGFFQDGKYLSLVGGYNFKDGAEGYNSGDIFISTIGNYGVGPTSGGDNNAKVNSNYGYEFVFDLKFDSVASGKFAYDVYDIRGINVETLTAKYMLNQTNTPISANPWRYVSGGQLIASGEFAFESGLTDAATGFTGGSHYKISGFDLSLLSIPVGTEFFSHFTMGCGNDNLMGQGTFHTPEPATMLLFGTGLAGLAGVARRRRK